MKPRLLVILAFAGLAQLVNPANAQPSGSVQRRIEDQQLRQKIDTMMQNESAPRPASPLIEGAPPRQAPSKPPQKPEEVPIKGVKLEGATLFSPQYLNSLQQRFVGQLASQANLNLIQHIVVDWYDNNKLLAHVESPRIASDGILTIIVVEARLGAVEVESNTSPIASGWAVATILDSVGIEREMRLDKLESAMLKLNDLGGVVAKARLEPGAKSRTTNVVLRLSTSKQIAAELDLNNYVTEYTGPYQAQLNATVMGVMGHGETISLDTAYSGNIDWYGSRNASLNVVLPVTPGGMNAVGSVNWSDYRLLSDLTADQFVGSYKSANFGITQSLWRRPKANLNARLIAEVDQFYDYVSGFEYSNRTNYVGRFSLFGDKQDGGFGGVGLNSALLTLSVGSLSKNAEGENELDSLTMGAAGAWGKVNLIYNRLQTFRNSPLSLELFGQAQVGFSNLDSAEKMSLGWPNAVRAYPPGEASGDTGIAGQLTARYKLAQNVYLKGFVDGGLAQRWVNWFTFAQSPGSVGLWGPGLGLEWGTRGDVLMSVDLAIPLGENLNQPSAMDVDGNNPDIRLWVSFKKWL